MLMKRVTKRSEDGGSLYLCFDESPLGLAFKEIRKQLFEEVKDENKRFEDLQMLSRIAMDLYERG